MKNIVPKRTMNKGQTGSKGFPTAMQQAVFVYLPAAFPILTARVQTVQLRCVRSRLLSKRKPLKLSKQLPNKPSRQRSKQLRSRLRSKLHTKLRKQWLYHHHRSRLHKQHRQRNKLQVWGIWVAFSSQEDFTWQLGHSQVRFMLL